MSIIVSDLSYHYFNQRLLFEALNFSIPQGSKVSFVGNNGVGKSTLMKLLAAKLTPSSGTIRTSSHPYYIPQQIDVEGQTIAEALGVSAKIKALNVIYGGSTEQSYFDILNEEWDIEERCHLALKYWSIEDVCLETPLSLLSGGEKTKVLLAGLELHNPGIVLLDEPTNHLDLSARKRLYEYIFRTKATVVVVSHDITLLNLLDTTYELSTKGIKLHGGGYDFYREQKDIEHRAIERQIDTERTALRLAHKRAQQMRERQDRRASKGERDGQKGGAPRIVMNARGNLAENSAAKLKQKHSVIIDHAHKRLLDSKQRQEQQSEMKIDFSDAKLHERKMLITAKEINYCYTQGQPLWHSAIDVEIRSGDRVQIIGDNGSGKSTLIRLLLGELAPTQGEVIKSNFSYVYLDQEYEQVNLPLTVLQVAERYNHDNMADHEVKLRLNRALLPQEMWDKSCQTLSGGERMSLYLCCLMISNHTPDIIILDEPTNNLDISRLSILTEIIKNYRGTILIVSHDEYFINEIVVGESLELSSRPDM